MDLARFGLIWIDFIGLDLPGVDRPDFNSFLSDMEMAIPDRSSGHCGIWLDLVGFELSWLDLTCQDVVLISSSWPQLFPLLQEIRQMEIDDRGAEFAKNGRSAEFRSSLSGGNLFNI